MKIYTKTGDNGETSLLGGTRVKKYHARIDAYGTIDELNSFVGVLRDALSQDETNTRASLERIQNTLFVVGSNLAVEPEGVSFKLETLHDEDLSFLESQIDLMDAELPALRNFILPGGHPLVSAAHVARTVCRRAERHLVFLAEDNSIDLNIITYINRLSDYFFVLARFLGQRVGAEEMIWKSIR